MRLIRSIPTFAAPATALLLAFLAVPAHASRLDVEVWTDRGSDAVYEPGDPMRVKVRTTDDAYLLVYEIDSEGAVNLLYPFRRGTGRIEARRTLRLPDEASDYQLVVERATGQGFIVAVASDRPFRELPWFLRPFDPQAASVGYEGDPEGSDRSEEGFDEHGRVVGDPYVAMERIRRRVVDQPGNTEALASAYATYYVHEQVRYPRYLCNDCHRPERWAWWDGFDPYYTHCSVIDFRVNWSWCWGPQLWTGYVPYYFYCFRSDCPPRYNRFAQNHDRFSSWDGSRRFGDLWGGQLRRYKGDAAPVSYTPPPPRGTVWRQGQTPPGYVPPDVRRLTGTPGGQAGWLQRDRGDGKPVWREIPRTRPDGDRGTPPVVGQGSGSPGSPAWRDWRPRGGDSPPSGGETPTPRGQGGSERGGDRGNPWRRGGDSPRYEPPRHEPQHQDPPHNDPPRQDPPRNDSPHWKQPPSDAPRWSPRDQKPDPPRGHGGKG